MLFYFRTKFAPMSPMSTKNIIKKIFEKLLEKPMLMMENPRVVGDVSHTKTIKYQLCCVELLHSLFIPMRSFNDF